MNQHVHAESSPLGDLLRTFALQAGGEGGARLARTAGVPVSSDTLLRLLRASQDQLVPAPRVVNGQSKVAAGGQVQVIVFGQVKVLA